MLSNQECQQLAAIERQLGVDDPKFVRRFESRTTAGLRGGRPRKPTTSQRMGGFLCSLAFLVGGPWELSLSPDLSRRPDIGHYGYCARCGQTIEHDRLEANPTAMLCMPCQHAKQQPER